MSILSPTPAEIREELGSPSTTELSDALLQRIINEERTYYGSAARAAEILYRKYALQADVDVEGYRERFSQIAEQWRQVAAELRRKAALYGAQPYFGGTSKTDIAARRTDPDRPGPDFYRGQWDNEG